MLLLTLGLAWMAARGYGSPEVEATYTRALALSEQGGKTLQLFSAQLGRWSFYLLRSQLKTAQTLAERLLGLAQDSHDPEQLAEANRVLGSTLFRLGEIRQARKHLEQALLLHRPDRHSCGQLLVYARNPVVHTLSSLSWILWYQGLHEQSLARSHEALAMAKKSSDPFNLCLALIFAAELHQRRCEPEQALGYANAALELSTEHGFPLYLARAKILRGWSIAQQGDYEASIALIQEGFTAHEATGAVLGQPSLLGLLAEVYGRAGKCEVALSVLDEASALIAETEERFG